MLLPHLLSTLVAKFVHQIVNVSVPWDKKSMAGAKFIRIFSRGDSNLMRKIKLALVLSLIFPLPSKAPYMHNGEAPLSPWRISLPHNAPGNHVSSLEHKGITNLLVVDEFEEEINFAPPPNNCMAHDLFHFFPFGDYQVNTLLRASLPSDYIGFE